MSKGMVMSGWPPGVVSLKVTGELNCGLKVLASVSSLGASNAIAARARAAANPPTMRTVIIAFLPLGSVQDCVERRYSSTLRNLTRAEHLLSACLKRPHSAPADKAVKPLSA